MDKLKVIHSILRRHPMLFIKDYIGYQISSLFPVFTGLLISKLFSQYEVGYSKIIWLLIGLFVGTLLGRIVAVLSYAISNSMSRFQIYGTLGGNMLKMYLDKPGAEAPYKSPGEIINHFKEDIYQIEEYVAHTFSRFISMIIFAVVALGILLYTDWKMTLFVFTPLVGIVLLLRRMGDKITRYRIDHRGATSKVSGMIGELFSNVQAMKIAGSHEHAMAHFNILNNEREKAAIKDYLFKEFIMACYSNILALGTGIILLGMALDPRGEMFKLSTFTLFCYYINFISGSIQYFAEFIIQYKRAIVSLNTLQGDDFYMDIKALGDEIDFIHLEKEEEMTKRNIEKITFKDLSYTYRQSDKGIQQVTITIEPGEMIVITGRVGSGKSTAVKSMLGLLEAKGEWYIGKEKIEKETILKDKIGAYTPQTPQFFSTSLRENLTLGRDIPEEKILKVLDMCDFIEDLATFEKGLEQEIGVNGVKLSGGQKQRLSIARMLLTDSQVGVIDDISSALDIKTAQRIWEKLFGEKNKSYIIVSNRREELEKADKIIVMKEGQVESEGVLADLLKTSRELQLIWGEMS